MQYFFYSGFPLFCFTNQNHPVVDAFLGKKNNIVTIPPFQSKNIKTMVSVFGGDISLENQRRDENRIQRRRERDEARRRKLLNAKTRLMGVDTSALDMQVEESKRRKEAEKQAEQAYANSMSQIKDILETRQMQENEMKVEEALKTRLAWDIQQQQHQERATFDLNDKNELKKRAKWTDDDVVGPSSMRRFGGEDRFAGDRKKIQAAQMRDWCSQMELEKKQKKQRQEQESMSHADYLNQVDQIRNEMHQMEMEQRMADNFKTAQTNAELIMMREAERNKEAERVQQMNLLHSQKIENDPMLRESRNQAESVIPGRVRRDHWKGMTVSQLQEIQQQNYQVMLEKRAKEQQERAEEVRVFFIFWSFRLHSFFFSSLLNFFFH